MRKVLAAMAAAMLCVACGKSEAETKNDAYRKGLESWRQKLLRVESDLLSEASTDALIASLGESRVAMGSLPETQFGTENINDSGALLGAQSQFSTAIDCLKEYRDKSNPDSIRAKSYKQYTNYLKLGQMDLRRFGVEKPRK